MQLQNVRVRFIPTEKTDIREVGPMDEVCNTHLTVPLSLYISFERFHIGSAFLRLNQVVYDLVKHKFAAPNQVATIYDMKEVESPPIC